MKTLDAELCKWANEVVSFLLLKQLNVENYMDISLGINNTCYIFTTEETKTPML
tara:strand:- start:25290 stop:25451 length:162 start_codon:yes stop_codon:yes gene_type:complete